MKFEHACLKIKLRCTQVRKKKMSLFECLCEYKSWYVHGVVVLTVLGVADATYQYFYQDQYTGGRRTAVTIFAISVLLYVLVRCPRVLDEIPLLEATEARWINPYALSGAGAILSIVTVLLSCCGKRSIFIWSNLSSKRRDVDPNLRFPAVEPTR